MFNTLQKITLFMALFILVNLQSVLGSDSSKSVLTENQFRTIRGMLAVQDEYAYNSDLERDQAIAKAAKIDDVRMVCLTRELPLTSNRTDHSLLAQLLEEELHYKNQLIVSYNDAHNKSGWGEVRQGVQWNANITAKDIIKFIPPALGAMCGAGLGKVFSNSNNPTKRVIYGALMGTLIGSAGSLGWHYYKKRK